MQYDVGEQKGEDGRTKKEPVGMRRCADRLSCKVDHAEWPRT